MEYNIKITKEQIKILNSTFCVYENGMKKGEIPSNCDECILRNIQWIFKMQLRDTPFTRDLCFLINHEKILTKNPKHIHH